MTWCHRYHITLKARHIPGCLNVMADLLSRSNQVQSTYGHCIHRCSNNLPEMFHSSCRSICHSPEPQASTVRVSSPRPKGLGHKCPELKLDGSHFLCLPSNGSPSQGDPKKIRHCHCLIIVIAPGLPGIAWFWDLVLLSTEIPLQLPVSTTLLKQSRNYVFHSNPQHLNLHAWCLRVDSSKNKASLWRWQKDLLPLIGHQQEPSTG